MQICKECNNINVSQIYWSTMYYVYQFWMFNWMSAMRGKESLECGKIHIYLSIENPKAPWACLRPALAANSSLQSHDFALMCRKLSASKSWCPLLAKSPIHTYMFYRRIINVWSQKTYSLVSINRLVSIWWLCHSSWNLSQCKTILK